MIESLCRITLVTFVFFIWLTMAFVPTLARAHDDDGKPKPPVVQSSTVPHENDRRQENALGAAAVSGLLTAALRDQQYGALKAIGGTVAAAAAIEAAQSGPFKGENVWWAFGGAAIGSVGVCQLYFRKGFAGCAVSFK